MGRQTETGALGPGAYNPGDKKWIKRTYNSRYRYQNMGMFKGMRNMRESACH